MTLEIQLMAWNEHKNMAVLNSIVGANTECHPPHKNPKREGGECFSYKKVNLTIIHAISLHIIFNISLDYQDIDSANTLQC